MSQPEKTGQSGQPVDVMRRALELQRASGQAAGGTPAPQAPPAAADPDVCRCVVWLDVNGICQNCGKDLTQRPSQDRYCQCGPNHRLKRVEFPPHQDLCGKPYVDFVCSECGRPYDGRFNPHAAPQSRSLVDVLDELSNHAGPYHFDPSGWPNIADRKRRVGLPDDEKRAYLLAGPAVRAAMRREWAARAKQPIPKGMDGHRKALKDATIYVKRAAFGDSALEAPVRLVEHTTLDMLVVIVYSRLPLADCLIDHEATLVGALSQPSGGERVFTHENMVFQARTFTQPRGAIGMYAHRFVQRKPKTQHIGDKDHWYREENRDQAAAIAERAGEKIRENLGKNADEFNRLIREGKSADEKRADWIAAEMGKPGFHGVPIFAQRDDQYATFTFVAAGSGVHQVKLDGKVLWTRDCVEGSSYELSFSLGSIGRHLIQVEAVEAVRVHTDEEGRVIGRPFGTAPASVLGPPPTDAPTH